MDCFPTKPMTLVFFVDYHPLLTKLQPPSRAPTVVVVGSMTLGSCMRRRGANEPPCNQVKPPRPGKGFFDHYPPDCAAFAAVEGPCQLSRVFQHMHKNSRAISNTKDPKIICPFDAVGLSYVNLMDSRIAIVRY
ncbi:hypothetical protein PanWU01x14_264180 [Parasponia andersonii]|uniref:Uncharacterized protein n=1 Tax=Parasponia andersonii TaxID=3476 RepID=A0A2P5B7Q2_PARAD|nr:hypothetical protein PanWU01x14_264180 [Parasponia andersonii]